LNQNIQTSSKVNVILNFQTGIQLYISFSYLICWAYVSLQDQNTNLIKITWKKLIKQGAKDSHPVLLLPNDLDKHFIKEHSFPVTLDLKGIRYVCWMSCSFEFFRWDGGPFFSSRCTLLLNQSSNEKLNDVR